MLVLLETPWHLFSASLVFVFGIFGSILVSGYVQVPRLKGLFLYAWHTLFCAAYLLFSLDNVADSASYYIASFEDNSFSVGTSFVHVLTSLFSEGLGFSYIGTFLVFNFIGYVGLLAFYGSLRQVVKEKSIGLKWLAMGLVMLPSVSFWSSAIGKDAISFMSIGLSLWASLNLHRRRKLMIFAVTAMFMVRPHIAGLLVAALGAAVFFDEKTTVWGKVILGAIATSGAAFIIPFAIQYTGLVDLSNVIDFIDQRQNANMEGGSSLDISSMSLPMQLFTYSFRPLPWEAHNVMALFSSVENLLLLLLASLGIFGSLRWGVDKSHANVLFLVLYLLMAWGILAVTTANLGIAARQKWMFMPYLIFLVFSCLPRIPFSFGSGRSPIPTQPTT